MRKKRLASSAGVDKRAMMDEGRMVEVGTYEELLALGGKFAELDRLNRIREQNVQIGEQVAITK